MDDLKKALIIRRDYNRMPFDEFAKMVEEYIGEKIPEKETFQYAGLLNIDFFTMWVDF